MKTKWIPIIVALVIVVAAGAAFGGYTFGVKAGQAQAADVRAGFLAARGLGSQQGMAGPSQGGAGFPGAGASGQSGGLQANVANFAAGQVKQVDGSTIQLSTATEVLKVKIGDRTQFQKMGQGSISDIQPGERITVQGARASDGSFTAQMIQIGSGPGGGAPPAVPGTPATKN